jgi:protein TonB
MFRRPGGGLQSGRGGIEGEPIPLDTKDPKYHEYFERVRQKIRANWGYPREAGERNIEGQLLIEFHIARDGRLSYLELVRSSGVKILDDYAMNAVRLAQPFPPVPEGLLVKHAVPISGMFVYRVVDAGSLVNQFLR